MYLKFRSAPKRLFVRQESVEQKKKKKVVVKKHDKSAAVGQTTFTILLHQKVQSNQLLEEKWRLVLAIYCTHHGVSFMSLLHFVYIDRGYNTTKERMRVKAETKKEMSKKKKKKICRIRLKRRGIDRGMDHPLIYLLRKCVVLVQRWMDRWCNV